MRRSPPERSAPSLPSASSEFRTTPLSIHARRFTLKTHHLYAHHRSFTISPNSSPSRDLSISNGRRPPGVPIPHPQNSAHRPRTSATRTVAPRAAERTPIFFFFTSPLPLGVLMAFLSPERLTTGKHLLHLAAHMGYTHVTLGGTLLVPSHTSQGFNPL